jgi:hypothetical protein
MKIKHGGLAKVLGATVCLFSAVHSYAAGEITYEPADVAARGCTKYKALSATSSKALKITCPDAASGDSFTLKYEPSSSNLTWCGAYDRIVVAADKTVTISCAPLFTITPDIPSVTLNTAAAFTVMRTTPAASGLNLELSGVSGHFTDINGKEDKGQKMTVPFGAGANSSEKIYALLIASGTATVTASAAGSSPITQAQVSVNETVVCPPVKHLIEANIGTLESKLTQHVIRFSPTSLYWQIEKGESFAIKFKPNASPPPGLTYTFIFNETTGYPNTRKEIAVDTCAGGFTGIGPNCHIKQLIGSQPFSVFASNLFDYKVCRVEPGKEYFLNIRDAAAGTTDDQYPGIKFLFSIDSY